GSDTVPHSLQRIWVLAQFGRQLRKQKFVTLHGLRSIDAESLGAVAGISFYLVEGFAGNSCNGTEVVHLAVEVDAGLHKTSHGIARIPSTFADQPECSKTLLPCA